MSSESTVLNGDGEAGSVDEKGSLDMRITGIEDLGDGRLQKHEGSGVWALGLAILDLECYFFIMLKPERAVNIRYLKGGVSGYGI